MYYNIRVKKTEDTEIEELKRLFDEYKLATNEADKAEINWSEDPTNEELENAHDEAYAKEYRLYQDLSIAIVAVTNGQISLSTAETMVNKGFDELEKIINKIDTINNKIQ